MAVNNDIDGRSLELLGSGCAPESVAAALGISVSRISQLLSTPEFAAQVAELRFKNLQKHTVIDGKYDEMEDVLLERLKNCLPMMYQPMQIIKAIQVINAAKRRGASAPSELGTHTNVVQINVPVQIRQKFITNINQQVVRVGEQDLTTIQPASLLRKIKEIHPQLDVKNSNTKMISSNPQQENLNDITNDIIQGAERKAG